MTTISGFCNMSDQCSSSFPRAHRPPPMIKEPSGLSFFPSPDVLWKTCFTNYESSIALSHNYLYVYLSEFQSQNPFRFNCQCVKVITFVIEFHTKTSEINKHKRMMRLTVGQTKNLKSIFRFTAVCY